ncbi:MAG: AAA domain-containing protein [Bacteroidota bacterium]
MTSDLELASSAYAHIQRVEESNGTISTKVSRLHVVFNTLLTHIAGKTQVLFTSMFARLNYVATAYSIPYYEVYLLHTLRRWTPEQSDSQVEIETIASLAVRILLRRCLKLEVDISSSTSIYRELTSGDRSSVDRFQRIVRVVLNSINPGQRLVSATLIDEPYEAITIWYGIPDRNEDLSQQMSELHDIGILPIIAHLIDVEIDSEGRYRPNSIVFEPDLLYDVTSISECFGPFAHHETGYLLRKFTPKATSKAIVAGNLANYLLDQLMHDTTKAFESFIEDFFHQDPLGIALLTNEDVRELLQDLEQHYTTIRKVVIEKLPRIGIQSDNYLIEPSFYSAKYGMQGRLDLFAKDTSGAAIIELKSGKTYRPNNYGLNNNHYHQTLLYDQLIESVYGHQVKRNCFILYSKATSEPLRFAPAIKAQQREAIKVRNQLYLHDRHLQKCGDIPKYLRDYTDRHAELIKGYQRRDTEALMKDLDELDKLEIAYFHSLIQFSINEWLSAKLTGDTRDSGHSLASMWREHLDTKIENYNILNHLTLHKNHATESNPLLVFRRTSKTAELSNFRVGDLGVVYPYNGASDDVLRSQVFKVTVLSMDELFIKVRLRSRQDNASIFHKHTFWNIEHDSLDSGYGRMTRSAYEWARAPKSYRDTILCLDDPPTQDVPTLPSGSHLTEEQATIYAEAIAAEGHYLIWGPPGTGKTSVVLRELANHYIRDTDKRILLMGYTNRAVDEICQALYSLEPRPSFIRIGSRYSSDSRYVHHLLGHQIEGVSSRHELRDRLSREQVYVGTIASILGKDDLFALLDFDVAIIDEASQLLEATIVGLLSRFKKWIMIGDHQQLPAIVLQPEHLSEEDNPTLQDVGIVDYRISLFERLYRTALDKGWHNRIGQLSFQGRMHQEIMRFPSERFYGGALQTLPQLLRLQVELTYPEGHRLKHRLMYVPSEIETEEVNLKVNSHEARICADLLIELTTVIETIGEAVSEHTFGIITPYRAQIAQIKKAIERTDFPYPNMVTIDTVERYQGGARDIIIMSTCMNYSFQLAALISMSREGTDRKFNVALTRAREQFILIGNEAILCQNPLYKEFIQSCYRLEMS